MKISALAIGAGLVISGATASHAQVNVQQEVKVDLTVQVGIEQNSTDDSAKLTKFRFGTKDLLNFLDTATGEDVRKVVLRRATAVPGNADPVTNGNDLLNEPVVLLGAADAVVAETAAITQAALTLPGTTLGDTAASIKDTATGNHTARRDLLLQGTTWTLDANDSTAETTDQIVFDLVGLVSADSKRKTSGSTDQGLFLTGWSADVQGGFHWDDAVAPSTTTGNVDGVVSGTISAGPEKLLPAS